MDRYLNTCSTRYLLRADRIEQAEKVISLFTKAENVRLQADMQLYLYLYLYMYLFLTTIARRGP